jgi:hypothetical protein
MMMAAFHFEHVHPRPQPASVLQAWLAPLALRGLQYGLMRIYVKLYNCADGTGFRKLCVNRSL